MASNGKITTLYEPMSTDQVLRIDRKRWRRHQISRMPEGVSIEAEVPVASFYYRTGDVAVEVAAEYSGVDRYDVILDGHSYDRQINVVKLEPEPAHAETSRAARLAIEAWMKAKGWRFKYTPELPPLALR